MAVLMVNAQLGKVRKTRPAEREGHDDMPRPTSPLHVNPQAGPDQRPPKAGERPIPTTSDKAILPAVDRAKPINKVLEIEQQSERYGIITLHLHFTSRRGYPNHR